MTSASTKDRNGKLVRVGSRVRVLEIAAFLEGQIPPGEWAELQSMVGEVFEVYEIDATGSAWVEKEWDTGKGLQSHSIGLESHEMEVA